MLRRLTYFTKVNAFTIHMTINTFIVHAFIHCKTHHLRTKSYIHKIAFKVHLIID